MFENQELANWLEACLKEIFQQEESRKIDSACVVARCAYRLGWAFGTDPACVHFEPKRRADNG